MASATTFIRIIALILNTNILKIISTYSKYEFLIISLKQIDIEDNHDIKYENICLLFIHHPLASCISPEGLIYIFSSTKSSKLKFLRSIFRDLPFCCNLKKKRVLLNIRIFNFAFIFHHNLSKLNEINDYLSRPLFNISFSS